MSQLLFRAILSSLAVLLLSLAVMPATVSAQPARAWVGVVLGESDPRPGVDIDIVLRRSPAHEAGLRDGDRIIAVDGRPVRTRGKLESIFREQRAGSTVVVALDRDGNTEMVEIEVATSPGAEAVLDGHHRGYPTPSVPLTDLDGESISFEDYDDQLLVVEFWATWCSVCRQVSRKFESALAEHPEAFTVLSVTSEDISTVEEHLKTQPKAHQIAIDEGNQAHDAFLVNGYPFVAVVDPGGEIRTVVTSVDRMDDLIADLVGSAGDADDDDRAQGDEANDDAE